MWESKGSFSLPGGDRVTGLGEEREEVRALTPERLYLGPSSRGGWCLMAPFLGGDDQNPHKHWWGSQKIGDLCHGRGAASLLD